MSVSATAMTGEKDVGGRPVGLKARKKALTLDLIRLVGPANLRPLVTENIQRAVDLTCAAWERRQRMSSETSAAEMVAICALEDAADKALGRLGLSSDASPRPARTVAGALADALEAGVAA
jgi:hypothetical protein